ncbi:MAG: hypothetical protein MJ252_13615 [archaeon]|nr:hypothetical protein [archaeon]
MQKITKKEEESETVEEKGNENKTNKSEENKKESSEEKKEINLEEEKINVDDYDGLREEEPEGELDFNITITEAEDSLKVNSNQISPPIISDIFNRRFTYTQINTIEKNENLSESGKGTESSADSVEEENSIKNKSDDEIYETYQRKRKEAKTVGNFKHSDMEKLRKILKEKGKLNSKNEFIKSLMKDYSPKTEGEDLNKKI